MIELNVYDKWGKLKNSLIRDEEKQIVQTYNREALYQRYSNIKIEYKDLVIYNPDSISIRYSKEMKCVKFIIIHSCDYIELFIIDPLDYVYITLKEEVEY